MKYFKSFVLLLIVSLFTVSCYDDNDDIAVTASEINDFVWKGMNVFYLYKENSPNLANDRFTNNADYANYLNSFSEPEDLFESLIYDRQTIDRFSIIVDDYIALEQSSVGVFKTNGMEFILALAPNSDTELVGVVRLVLRDSDATIKGVKRGDLFYAINGTRITRSNAGGLLNQDIYTINLGEYDDKDTPETTDDSIESNGIDISLEKFQYTENPIYINDIFQINGANVGYLMYNGFSGGSENGLNTVFGNFKSNNVQHLVLDLRYNPGGFISTTTFLASMITGQFTGQVFEKLIYNENLQELNTDYLFTNNFDGSTINSLGLNKIYVLTTDRSASASEGLINGLNPYIEVVQIGTETIGKTQASRIFYDSANFGRQGVNPSHTYAIRPLIANGVNKNNQAVPGTGLVPSIGFEYSERLLDLGILGDVNEPMLALALAAIENSTGKFLAIKSETKNPLKLIKDSSDFNPFEGGMIID